jgi:hypothetical protein
VTEEEGARGAVAVTCFSLTVRAARARPCLAKAGKAHTIDDAFITQSPSLLVKALPASSSFIEMACGKYDVTKAPYLGYKELFDQVDADKSGAVDHDEFRALIQMLGMTASKAEVDAMVKAADTDGNKEIDFEEARPPTERETSRGSRAKSFMP